ncbi:hypothetical protein ACLKMH_15420 [Psychromonas sp. KJ10-10]|uniref:hypothetical protein n=1 Tax=Psychromonas sp. KJ10-10 TaxID=3391823 RepID=UPI0039B6A2C4
MKALFLFSLLTSSVLADQVKNDTFSTSLDFAQVEFVEAKQSSDKTWCFNTRVRHQDEGWEHYANVWKIHDLNDQQLGERVLLHPHDTEQPFTRSLCQVVIPENISKVVVSAECNLHGDGGQVVVLDLTTSKGLNYTVKHY